MRRGATRRRCQGSPPVRPSGRAPARPTSGSRNARLRCTGPAGGPIASHTARGRQRPRRRPASASSGTATSENHRTRRAEEARLVDGLGRAHVRVAPVVGRPCTTPAGTRPRSASTAAGCSSAAAVPLVVSTTQGRSAAVAMPERGERRRALVVVHVHPKAIVVGERHGERRGP